MYLKTCLFALLLALLMLAAPALAEDPLAAYQNHPLMGTMGQGVCTQLRGSIPVTVVFVSVGDTPWTQADIAGRKQIIQDGFDLLESNAAAYGVPLRFTAQYYQTSTDTEPSIQTGTAWCDQILQDIPALRSRSGSDWCNQPLVFICSMEGRTFAISYSQPDHPEFLISYQTDVGVSIAHEMLHLFGAPDYYIHPDVKAAALRLIPDSIMLSGDQRKAVDPLSACIVGWTTSPGSIGMQLLKETAHVTKEDFRQAGSANMISGLGSLDRSNSRYEGVLLDGEPDGWGREVWNSGESYLGVYDRGLRTGLGIYAWPDGQFYAGDFVNGKRIGRGYYVWADGSSYTGDFTANGRTGFGSYLWADGSYYTGEFLAGQKHGRGTHFFANGDTYTGEYEHNEMSGHGVYIFADGTVYTGGFRSGKLHGEGTMIYPDGRVVTGIWKDGTYQSGR